MLVGIVIPELCCERKPIQQFRGQGIVFLNAGVDLFFFNSDKHLILYEEF